MKNIGLLALVLTLALVSAGAQQQTPEASQSESTARRPPQAKSQAEYNDYSSAYALNSGPVVEKAAGDFAAKYPQSELREYLYLKALHEYQNENNSEKILAMGEKVLALDRNNSIALVLTATVLSDSLSDGDADRAQKIAQIKTNAQRALETVDTSFTPPPNATPEQIEVYKDTLQCMAHTALGIMELKTGDYQSAKRELRAATDFNRIQPDPYIWYHLALSEDHLGEYADGLISVNKALQYIGTNSDLERLARGERERLARLSGHAAVDR